MNKNITFRKLFLLLMFFPITLLAQTDWTKPDFSSITGEDTIKTQNKEKKVKEKKEKEIKNEKYLEGAVPQVDGNVEWTLDLDVPGKSAQQIYDIILKCFYDITQSSNQLEGSCVSLVNEQEHSIIASIKEWLTFTNSVFSLDRSRFFYTLVANCEDNHLLVKMQRISYKYDEDTNKNNFYKAEDIITDSQALNKSKTHLILGIAKFRKKTVDRKDELFNMITEAVLK